MSSEKRDTQPFDGKRETAEAPASPPDKLTAFFIACPICNYQNPVNAILCIKCQNVLQPETKRIGRQDVEGRTNWGTSEIEKKLYLHIRHLNEMLEISIDQDAEFAIGRVDPITGQKPPIDLSEFGAAEKGVSRFHAKLIVKDGALKIADLDSANYTYLNGQKLVPNQARILRDGDELRLGHLVMTVQFGEAIKSL